MGRLRRRDAPIDTHELLAETSVGRAASAGLRLLEPHVSMQHASVRWTERGTWELRDHQSKNGTYLNGQRIPPGEPVRLDLGARVAFGLASEVFVMVDVSPPRPMLLRIDGEADPIPLSGSLLGLPSLEEPTVSVFRGDGGRWYIDSAERVGPLTDGDLITVGTGLWRCCLPTAPDETELVEATAGLFSLAEAELRLLYSPDEETVELALRVNGQQLELGSKACHYLLLTLARCRLERDLPPSADVTDGWIGLGSLLSLLRVTEQRLNVDIFRIRQELKTAGIVDAVNIVERDPARRRLRLGTGRLTLSRSRF